MDRREALKCVAVLLGGAVSAPTVMGILGGCQTGPKSDHWQPATLSSEQNEMVTLIAELIIPETDTPGAKAARVNEFIDLMLMEWYNEEERDAFLKGLTDTEAYCISRFQKGFCKCSKSEQTKILSELEDEALSESEEKPPRAEFFKSMKELTLLGYYTSEIGATRELRQNPMGTFNGCIPFSEAGRAWS